MPAHVIAKYFSSLLFSQTQSVFLYLYPHCTHLCSPARNRTLHLLSSASWKPALSPGCSESHETLKLNICTVTTYFEIVFRAGAQPSWLLLLLSFPKDKYDGRRVMSRCKFVSKDDFLYQTERKKMSV